MRLRALILSAGKTAAGIEIPTKVVSALGASKKPPVRVTINGGYTYRSTIATVGGKFMIGVSNEVRKAAGVEAGQMVDLDIELDDQPREVELPADFKAALARDTKAKQVFDGLSYSKKRSLVTPIDVKSEETRKRRITETIAKLKAGRI